MIYFLLGLVLVGLTGSSPTKFGDKLNIKIVGGDDIDIRQAPYQIALLFRGRFSCGGALISDDIVITAAHCVNGAKAADLQIRAGSSLNARGGQVVQVQDLIWNPDFSYSKMDSDIALLWLARPLVFNDAIQPVEMIDSGMEIANGDITYVTGWGLTGENGDNPATLQGIQVPKISSEICAAAYRPLYNISPRMLCAADFGKDACQGDSGGPLVHNGKLAGVVSWGLGCARPDYPGVYAKVSAMRKWIDENIFKLKMKRILRDNQ